MEIREERASDLEAYSRVSISFEVRSVLDVVLRDAGLGGVALVERTLATPFIKDYDAIAGNHPTDWATRFDLSTWELFSMRENGHVLGCAAIAFDAPGLTLTGRRSDLAVLWDLRVDAQSRRRGIGRELFAEAARHARRRGARWLSIETQNTNVPACRFYVHQGCTLGAVNRFAYADLRDEVQLVWYKSLICEGAEERRARRWSAT